MRPGAAGELSAGGRVAVDGASDLLERHGEHVVQEEGGALERRQALQRQHQRERGLVRPLRLRARRLDQRLG